MRNSISVRVSIAFALVIALLGCGSGSSDATQSVSVVTRSVSVPNKGFQLVLLPYWNVASVGNFLSVAKNSRSPQIEFTFLPFRPRNTDPNPPSNFVNARRIVDELSAVGKAPLVTVYLSFHAQGTGYDQEIGVNAKNFNDNFLSQYINKAAQFNICPSLEDYGSDADFQRWAGIVASKLGSNFIGRVAIRRCGLNSHGTVAQGRFAGVQNEFHGSITGNGTHYSNDGNLVYYPAGRETAASLLGINHPPQYSLDSFKSGTSGRSGVLLWRPAYNLLWRDDSQSVVTFDPSRRQWNDPQTAFGSYEIAVAKLFLNIP